MAQNKEHKDIREFFIFNTFFSIKFVQPIPQSLLCM